MALIANDKVPSSGPICKKCAAVYYMLKNELALKMIK